MSRRPSAWIVPVRGFLVAAFVTVLSPPYVLFVIHVRDGFKWWMLLGIAWPALLAWWSIRPNVPYRRASWAFAVGVMAIVVFVAASY